MSKPQPSDFLKSGSKPLKVPVLPTMVVTGLAKGAFQTAKSPSPHKIAYSIDSLEKLTTAFEQSERALGKR